MSPLPVELLRRAARTWPDRVAAREDGEAWTWAELLARSRPLPVAPGSPVVLLAGGGLASVRAHWAALRAGAVAVELDPALRDDDLRRVLETVRPAAAVVAHEHRARLAGLPLVEPGDGEEREPAAGDVAAIVHTSGTTGGPKGVLLTHGNLGAVTAAIAESFGLAEGGPREVFSGALPLHYTYGRSVVLLSTLLGGEVAFTRRAPTAATLLALCREAGVTHLSLVPFQAAALLRHAGFEPGALPALRRLTIAGGALAPAARDALAARWPGRVIPMYGLTEAATRLTCLPPGELERRPASCGRAIPGVELEVRDEADRPAPPGVLGEVVARGPNVSPGYHADPALTARTFEGGWLRTGDLGRLDAEGYLTLEGRSKDVIKVLGENVSGRAIEEVVAELPDVLEVAAVGVPDVERGEAVALFVVPRAPGADVDRAAIRARVAARLGGARVPRSITVLAALPRTASGKVRKGELRP